MKRIAKKEGRPSWFKMFLHQKALIDAVPDDTAGKALKAVFQYFDSGEVGELDPMAFAVFSSIKPYVDESYDDFRRNSQKNRENIEKRWKDQRKSNTTGTSGITLNQVDSTDTEAETDADAETETKNVQGIMRNEEMENVQPLARPKPEFECGSDEFQFEEKRQRAIDSLAAYST